MGKKLAFVVLHYNALEETKRCVARLLELKNSWIILVCNGSSNDSDEIILETYNHPRIKVFVNETNLGYAKGLNVGFLYAKYELKADFIICMNNDVIVEQLDFDERIAAAYEKHQFALAGPDVMNLAGEHCNPRYIQVPTEDSVNARIKKLKMRLAGCKMFWGLPEILRCVMKKVVKRNTVKSDENALDRKILHFHGCFWIFSKQFIAKNDGICPRTYLYGEETILSYQCFRQNLKMVYLPEIQVLHRESVATKLIYRNVIKRHMFYFQNEMQSKKVLLDIVNGGTFGNEKEETIS